MISEVKLGDRSYDICIDETGSFVDKIRELFPKNSFVFVTNKTIEKIYEAKLSNWESSLEADRIVIEDGEEYKNLETWEKILAYLLEKRYDRKTVLIAFGGGVVGDLTGFVAASYLRGINFVQVPTTLLAMVDSSVGGKTAVNHKMGKNLIGAFYQPKLVWIDTQMAKTLSDRDFVAGFGEVYKYGFIGGREMFEFVRDNSADILARNDSGIELFRKAVKLSVDIKATVVADDERESGSRALLNFGHTFGHALEKYYNYKGILHGEGIWWGIKCAILLSLKINLIPKSERELFENSANNIKLPKLPTTPNINELYDAMFSDKKVLAGEIRFILPQSVGASVIKSKIAKESVVSVLNNLFI